MGYRNQFLNQGVPQVWAVGTVLDAAICGAVSVCILRFANVAVNGVGIADGTTANLGTEINITRAGVYYATLTYATTANGTVNNIGISQDAAALAVDPTAVTAGMFDYASCLSPVAANSYAKLSCTIFVSPSRAAGTSTIRFHAGDGLNATPLNTDVTLAECRFAIHLVSNLVTNTL